MNCAWHLTAATAREVLWVQEEQRGHSLLNHKLKHGEGGSAPWGPRGTSHRCAEAEYHVRVSLPSPSPSQLEMQWFSCGCLPVGYGPELEILGVRVFKYQSLQ